MALNDAGLAVGTLSRLDGSRAAVWQVGGAVTELGTLGGGTSAAHWVAETGAVFGHSATAEGYNRGFVWRDGRMRDLGTLGGPITFIRQISAAGDVVGDSATAAGEAHGFLWRGGRMVDLGPVPDFEPAAVNVWGQVLGCSFDPGLQQYRLWLWQNGRRVDLAERAGGFAPNCDVDVDVNDRGQIVGVVTDPATQAARGVMWTVSPLWGYL